MPDGSPNGSRLDAEVVVIGSGPAGCIAALTLAAEGVSVLVAEQDQPGKNKPCGDAYVPAAIGLARQLGLSMDAFSRCGVRLPHLIFCKVDTSFGEVISVARLGGSRGEPLSIKRCAI